MTEYGTWRVTGKKCIQLTVTFWSMCSFSFLNTFLQQLYVLQIRRRNLENSRRHKGWYWRRQPCCFLSQRREQVHLHPRGWNLLKIHTLESFLWLRRSSHFAIMHLSDENRSAPTGHVGVGAVQLSVSLHYLLLLPPAACVMFWRSSVHHTVQLHRLTVRISQTFITLWRKKKKSLNSWHE